MTYNTETVTYITNKKHRDCDVYRKHKTQKLWHITQKMWLIQQTKNIKTVMHTMTHTVTFNTETVTYAANMQHCHVHTEIMTYSTDTVTYTTSVCNRENMTYSTETVTYTANVKQTVRLQLPSSSTGGLRLSTLALVQSLPTIMPVK